MTARKAEARQRLMAEGVRPRAVALSEAAAYVGLCPEMFRREVAAGRLPPPLPIGGRRRLWDVRRLDAALDALSGLGADARSARAAPVDPADDPILAAIRGARG